MNHLPPHEGDYVINTDNKDVQQIVDEMRRIIEAEENESDRIINE